MANNRIPMSVSDVLLHQKNGDLVERVILPITRYDNVLNAPNVVKGSNDIMGAPFHLLEVETEELSIEDVRKLCGSIV